MTARRHPAFPRPMATLPASVLLTLALMALPPAEPGRAQYPLPDYHGNPIPDRVEAMYVKGLQYLVQTQSKEGNWQGPYGSDAGVVGLAVLAMLVHGEDPNFGPYSAAIERGIHFILRSARRDNGYIGTSMYNHGFATLALAEAYGSVRDERIGPALKKAVDLIIAAQARNSLKAWRYTPEQSDADTTVSGAQMVALLAARNAGISVPDSVIENGLEFFRRCQGGDGGIGYTSAGGSNGPRTAIGALVFALARRKDSDVFKMAFRYLQDNNRDDGYLFYFIYYASQAYFHADPKAWEIWNRNNIAKLSSTQNASGGWSGSHGETFCTASALLSLAVNYRFLPIYER